MFTEVDMDENQTKQMLNQILKDLFYKVMKIQVKSVAKATGGTLSRTEMHLLECVHDNPDVIMSDIAQTMGITKATASVSVGTLVKKGYLNKIQLPDDRRKATLELTQKGEISCAKHKKFHDMMVKSVLSEFEIERYPEVTASLSALLSFFDRLDD